MSHMRRIRYSRLRRDDSASTWTAPNSPGAVVTKISANLKENTEYTLYLFGEGGGRGREAQSCEGRERNGDREQPCTFQ